MSAEKYNNYLKKKKKPIDSGINAPITPTGGTRTNLLNLETTNAGGTTGGTEPEPSKNDTWKQYQNMLNVNKANLQAELGAVNQVANSTLDTYRKQLGLAGSGAGESVGLQSNLNYLNALAQANVGAQQAEQDFRAQESERFANLYQQALESGNYQAVKDLEKQYEGYEGLTPGTLEYLKATGNIANIWKSEQEQVLGKLSEQIDNNANLNESQKEMLSEIYNQLNKAESEEEYNNIINKYKETLKNPESVKPETSQLTRKYLYDLIGNPIMVGGGAGGKQDKHVDDVISAVQKGLVPDNSIIDLNYGGGTKYVLYNNGEFKYLDKLPSGTKEENIYDEHKIKSLLNPNYEKNRKKRQEEIKQYTPKFIIKGII